MKTLHLTLSSDIQGIFTMETRKIKKPFFMLNKSFSIRQILCDGSPIHYQKIEEKYNYQKISFSLPKHNSILVIQYEGCLDGTTGRWSYVKEKTSDSIYLLRDETVYYPVFEIPYSDAYFSHLTSPDKEERIRVSVERKGSCTVCSNLTCVEPFVYEGFHPAFAVGCLKKYKCAFGKIWLAHNDTRTVQELAAIVSKTNQYMNRFKKVDIKHFQIISIPKGYGCFALPGTMFLTQDAGYQGLVHELIHTNWNPCCSAIQKNSHFFDEGITQYFTARVCHALMIQTQKDIMETYRRHYRQQIRKWKKTPCPIEAFTAYNCGDLSYSLVPLALQAIEDTIGTEIMDQCLRKMLAKYQTEPIDFQHFRKLFPDSIQTVYTNYFLTDYAARKLLEEE